MIYKAPNIPEDYSNKSVFLAGSIEMGKAENWQERIGKRFDKLGYDVYDPRRDDWDSSWEQSYDNDNFREQVEWEMKHLSNADIMFFYFDPNTKSPITLYELGYATAWHIGFNKEVVVVCPPDFYRYGNVEVYAKSFNGYNLFDTEDEAFTYLENNVV